MLKIAFGGMKNIEISDFEILNGGKSYSYITAEHFKKEYPSAQLYMLVGADMLNDFFTWKNPEIILQNCKIAAFGREGYFCDYEDIKDKFQNRFSTDFLTVSFKGEDISSTEIRTYCTFGFSPAGVNPEVFKYIKENDVYFADEYVNYVKKVLPEKRLLHTANVVVCAEKKTKELGLDAENVRIAATLHDCAKYQDVKDYGGFSLPSDVPSPVVHAFLGAYIAETVLGIKDKEILDAIKYHTSGKAEMSTLAKLIFVADMLEKGRDYSEVYALRALYERDFELCFKECLKEEVKHLINGGKYIYKETLSAYDYYVTGEKI